MVPSPLAKTSNPDRAVIDFGRCANASARRGSADFLAHTTSDAGKAPPIPPAGRLAMPRSLEQVGLPIAATRATLPAHNPQTSDKIELGEKLFFDGRLSADGTVARR
jgi:cytochrome c peroxidase